MNAPAFFVVAAEVARLRRRELGRSPPNHHGPEENIMTIFALCVFSGGLDQPTPTLGPRRCARPDTQVFRLPPALKATLEVKGDDFVEVRREGNDDEDSRDAMEADVNRILEPFGGEIDCPAICDHSRNVDAAGERANEQGR